MYDCLKTASNHQQIPQGTWRDGVKSGPGRLFLRSGDNLLDGEWNRDSMTKGTITKANDHKSEKSEEKLLDMNHNEIVKEKGKKDVPPTTNTGRVKVTIEMGV